MWIFLITEIMFFGGMFLAYTVYRAVYPDVFALASSTLNVIIGAANTAVLLCSSFTMVLAVRGAQLGKRRTVMLFLILTLILGLVVPGRQGIRVEREVPGASRSRPDLPPGRHRASRATRSCSSRCISP